MLDRNDLSNMAGPYGSKYYMSTVDAYDKAGVLVRDSLKILKNASSFGSTAGIVDMVDLIERVTEIVNLYNKMQHHLSVTEYEIKNPIFIPPGNGYESLGLPYAIPNLYYLENNMDNCMVLLDNIMWRHAKLMGEFGQFLVRRVVISTIDI